MREEINFKHSDPILFSFPRVDNHSIPSFQMRFIASLKLIIIGDLLKLEVAISHVYQFSLCLFLINFFSNLTPTSIKSKFDLLLHLEARFFISDIYNRTKEN